MDQILSCTHLSFFRLTGNGAPNGRGLHRLESFGSIAAYLSKLDWNWTQRLERSLRAFAIHQS